MLALWNLEELVMNSKIVVASTLSFLTIAFSTNIAKAQGMQNWLNNEEGKIQQDMGAGALNSGQATGLQNQQAAIDQQVAQDRAANGGRLTQQQKQQVAAEEQNLNRQVNRDIYQNNPNAFYPSGQFGGYPRPVSNWNPNWNANVNPNYPRPQNWNPNWNQNVNPNVNPNIAPNGQPNQYPGQHHHHRWQNPQNGGNPQ
jgi:hypothetical protein